MSTPEHGTAPTPSAEPTTLPTSPRAAAFTFAVVKLFADHAAARMKSLKEDAPLVFERGDRLSVVSPVDRRVKLATVSTSDPADTATVTDETAFHDWMREHHDDKCQTTELLVGGRAQVIEALRKYAPPEVVDQLVTTDVVPAPWAVSQVLKSSAKAGQPVGPAGEIDKDAPPGIVVQEKAPVVSVRVADGGLEHFGDLMAAGHMSAALGLDPAALAAAEPIVIDQPAEDDEDAAAA